MKLSYKLQSLLRKLTKALQIYIFTRHEKNYTNTLSLGEMGQRKNKQQVTKTHVLHTHYDMKKEMKNERK